MSTNERNYPTDMFFQVTAIFGALYIVTLVVAYGLFEAWKTNKDNRFWRLLEAALMLVAIGIGVAALDEYSSERLIPMAITFASTALVIRALHIWQNRP